ncbi:MAG: PAC2 family protein [Candidatus Thorarchaeota archaeon]
MHLENLTGEIEDWLEKAEEEENLKFIRQNKSKLPIGTVVFEMLGYYGSVDRILTKEIQKMSQNTKKLAGFFSSYFNEMVQLYSGEILLPITILQSKIGSNNFILTTSNFAIPDVISYKLAEELYRFYQEQMVAKIFLLDGVYNYKRDIKRIPQVHRIKSSKFQIGVENKKSANFTLMGQVASSFLTYWSYNGDIPIEIIAVDSFSDYDPISSLELLKVITHQWGIKADFKELERRSQEFHHLYKQSKEEISPDEQKLEFDPRYFI